MSQYTYSVATDTANAAVDINALTAEIRSSAIVTALNHIEVFGDVLDIFFNATLSEGDITLLTSLVSSHTGVPLTTENAIPVEIKNLLPIDIKPTSTKNEHKMEPMGAVKGCYESRPTTGQKYVCNVTLSNKVVNGDGSTTFTYNSDIEITPEVGNYVFQNESSVRDWATSVDNVNYTMTFEQNNLSEGSGLYVKGFYTDFRLRPWAPILYLWGATISLQELEYVDNAWVLETTPCGDFLEMSVVDADDLFLTDEFCQAVFGVNAADAEPYLLGAGFENNGEYGHWTKYYDESWVLNCNSKLIKTIDSAPGELPAGLYLRVSLFTTELENHKYHIFLDYYCTSKS